MNRCDDPEPSEIETYDHGVRHGAEYGSPTWREAESGYPAIPVDDAVPPAEPGGSDVSHRNPVSPEEQSGDTSA